MPPPRPKLLIQIKSVEGYSFNPHHIGLLYKTLDALTHSMTDEQIYLAEEGRCDLACVVMRVISVMFHVSLLLFTVVKIRL